MTAADNWRPSANAARLRARADLLQNIRGYFASQQVMEVETPILSTAGNTDPEINSIRTQSGNFLRTSPEFPLKRLLAAGIGDVYELGRVFRDGETGRHHNPEFTMLEWYRTGYSYHQLMDEVVTLVRFCGQGKFEHWREERLGYRQLFLRHLHFDPFTADIQTLSACAKKNGIEEIELNHKQWLDLLISFVIQPALPEKCLTFVYDFPEDQAALARIRPGSPPLAERFELYLGNTELANGYQELTDANEQQWRFDAENDLRRRRGQEMHEPDQNLVSALRHGLPECAGVALGVDRLLMAITELDSIDDVTAFPSSRA